MVQQHWIYVQKTQPKRRMLRQDKTNPLISRFSIIISSLFVSAGTAPIFKRLTAIFHVVNLHWFLCFHLLLCRIAFKRRESAITIFSFSSINIKASGITLISDICISLKEVDKHSALSESKEMKSFQFLNIRKYRKPVLHWSEYRYLGFTVLKNRRGYRHIGIGIAIIANPTVKKWR